MKKILALLIPLIISCNAIRVNKDDCNENIKFKQSFFYHINYIDENISVLQETKFRESVIFVSNYAPVSVNRIMNYARTYPFGIYL